MEHVVEELVSLFLEPVGIYLYMGTPPPPTHTHLMVSTIRCKLV